MLQMLPPATRRPEGEKLFHFRRSQASCSTPALTSWWHRNKSMDQRTAPSANKNTLRRYASTATYSWDVPISHVELLTLPIPSSGQHNIHQAHNNGHNHHKSGGECFIIILQLEPTSQPTHENTIEQQGIQIKADNNMVNIFNIYIPP